VAKGKKKVVVEDEELEELEDLDDLEDEADEVADEADDDDEEDDDEDEAPRKSKKSKKGKKEKVKAAKEESDTIGSSDLAEALGTDGKNLRVMLRDREVKKNENGRYEWDSVDQALEALGFDDLEEAQEALAESRNKRLEALKERNAEAKAEKEKAATKKGKKKAVVEEEDDDDEEDEEPAPKKAKKKKAKK
jgi:hypothetical protein